MNIIEQLAFQDTGGDSFEAAKVEYEIEIYLEGFDIEEVKAKASSYEVQEQWGIYVPKTEQNASGGSMRVRRTDVTQAESAFVHTTKLERKGAGKPEHEVAAHEDLFDMYKLMADQGLIKTRYNVPAELANGTKYVLEVDVFYNKLGELIPWCKIDAEFPEGADVKLTKEDIPFSYSDIIICTPEQKGEDKALAKRISALYEKYFRTPNVAV